MMQTVFEFQSLQRKTFEHLRRMHRELITLPHLIEQFDESANFVRRQMRAKHQYLRALTRKTFNVNAQCDYDDYLIENKYFICTYDDCQICKYVLKNATK